ncbi:MAG: outer membrane beta-barrel protein [Vicinamibacteria bacterium]|nr:outer membrane beta-barrel protein [Vicinamibacteria bacterium]
MKRLYLTIILAMVLVSGTVLAHGNERASEAWIGGGLAMPQRPDTFKDYAKVGFGLEGGVGYKISPRLIIGVSAEYNRFSPDMATLEAEALHFVDVTTFDVSVDINGGNASIVGASAYTRLLLASQGAQPYVVARAGLARYKTSDATVRYTVEYLGLTTSDSVTLDGGSETALKIVAGAGVDVPVGETSKLFFEAAYNFGFTEEESTGHISVRAGLRFGL